MKKIAICFYGITRSLKYTLSSINENILNPSRKIGEARVFAHLYLQRKIENPRSGEFGDLDMEEYKLLNADVLDLEYPTDCHSEVEHQHLWQYNDPWADGYRSMNNFLKQMRSVDRVARHAIRWGADAYVFVRPDLLYLDSLSRFIEYAVHNKTSTIYYPNWQHHGGMNDRFALASSAESAKIYSQRGAYINDYILDIGGNFNGERLLKYALLREGIARVPIYARAMRVRLGGQSHAESFRRPRGPICRTTARYLISKNRIKFSLGILLKKFKLV